MNETLKQELKNMYYEMQEQQLHTILIPAPEPMHVGHKIRVADSQNPDWYRDLCADYPSNCYSHRHRKRVDTKIKRQSVLQFLYNPEKHSRFKYGDDLISIAQKRIDEYENDSLKGEQSIE